MTTRLITREEAERLDQELVRSGLSGVGELLHLARLRIVNAPEIGCMPILREHICQIDSPAEQYQQLSALPEQEKEELRLVLARFFQAGDPELNITDVDFYKQS